MRRKTEKEPTSDRLDNILHTVFKSPRKNTLHLRHQFEFRRFKGYRKSCGSVQWFVDHANLMTYRISPGPLNFAAVNGRNAAKRAEAHETAGQIRHGCRNII